MGQSYGQLTADERAVVMVMRDEGYNQASIARRGFRSPAEMFAALMTAAATP
jgi:hypothetical protein